MTLRGRELSLQSDRALLPGEYIRHIWVLFLSCHTDPSTSPSVPPWLRVTAAACVSSVCLSPQSSGESADSSRLRSLGAWKGRCIAGVFFLQPWSCHVRLELASSTTYPCLRWFLWKMPVRPSKVIVRWELNEWAPREVVVYGIISWKRKVARIQSSLTSFSVSWHIGIERVHHLISCQLVGFLCALVLYTEVCIKHVANRTIK